MAKNPTPQNDAAALAFSAVEDALKESVFNLDSSSQSAEKKPVETARGRHGDSMAGQYDGTVPARDSPQPVRRGELVAHPSGRR